MTTIELDHIELPSSVPAFELRDIVWALGMCAIVLSLSPVMAVYVLLVV